MAECSPSTPSPALLLRPARRGWQRDRGRREAPDQPEANAGFYWLRNAGEFFKALQEMILKDAHVNGRFFVAPALNELILRQKVIKTIRLQRGPISQLIDSTARSLRVPGGRRSRFVKHHRLSDMVKGWFVGNFSPVAFRTRGSRSALSPTPPAIRRTSITIRLQLS